MNFYEQLARLSPERRALLERKLAEKGLDAALPERIPPRADRGPAPLSFAQQRLWFVQQLEPDSTAYNVASVLRLQGPLDIRALARCIDTLVERHETLRTRFAATSGRQPAQIVEAARADRLASIDLRGEADPEVAARERIEHLTRTPFDLTRVPLRAALLQLAADTHLLVLATHHIVSDRWSVMVFLRELTVLYRAYTRGQSSPLAPLPIQYADWASWQREQLTGDALQRLTDYWTTQLAGDLPRLDLPFDRPRPVIAGDAGAQVPIALSPSLSKAVAALAQQHQATLFAVLLTTFDVLLHRYTDSADIVVGSDIANRERVETENLIGLLVNTLVLRTDLGGNPPFEALLSRVRQVVLDALAHQALPFEKLVELLNPERHLDQMMPLFQAKFDLQQATVKPVQLDGLTLTRETADETRTKYELRFNLQDTPDGIRGQVEYRSDLFDRATIERMVGHFEVLLTGIVADPACPIRDLPLLTETERHWLTDGWNDRTARDYPTDGTLHGLFERQAAAMPDAVAVTDGAHSLTYRELDLQASRLAHELIAMGAGREGPVGICMPRSPRLIVGLLAILKAGAAYVPLDPDYPAARLEFIVEDAGIDVLLTDRASTPLSPLLASRPGLRTVTVGDPAGTVAPETNPVRRSGPQHLAYVIYTSGSTGRPKGVAIEHRNAVTMLHWARETYGDADLAGMLAATSICFDLSVFEIFVPLAWGGRVVIAENLLALPRLPATVGVTLINTVPSVLTQLLSIAALPASVRTVNLAGEALPPDLIERLRRIPHVQRVYNLYGPSEDTTYSTVACFDVDRPAAAPLTRVPIGVPIANTQAYVVDATGHLVPVGVAGELLLGGAGLARGYLARPDLTAAGFVPNPFDRRSPRLYRTGDRVRRLPDGTLEFLGRADHQVKIRGFRIETGETETVLRQHPSVREAIVVAQPVRGTDLQLVAHVEMDTDDGNHAAAARLRTFLQQRLPIYLVPTRLHVTDRLPRLPNGKIDRRALSSADDEPVAAATPVAPRNATEQALAAIWRDVLRRDAAAPVGVDDNFFELGGHSLLAIEIVARIEQTLGRTVPLRLLFHAPTIAQLAVEVDRTNASGTSTTTVRGPLRSDPAARHAPFPLTDIQQAYLVGRNAAFELGNIGTHGYREIDVGGLAIDAVEHALRQLIDRHDMLRAIVTPDGQQRILADVPPVRIAVHALDAAADRDAQLQTIRERLSHQVFDPQRWPLFQVEATDLGDGRIRFHLSFDVLIGDAWSFQLLGRELAQLLQGATLAPLEASFRDYVLAEQAFTASAEHQRAVDYWQRRLDDLPPAPELPLTMAPSQIAAPRFVRRGGRLPAADWQRLKDRAQRAGLTPSGIALAVFAETLAGYARRPDFTLNLTLFNRYPLHPDVNRLVGDFTASLLLAVHERGTEPFATRARRLQAQLWDDLEHRAVGGVQVQRDLARRQQRSGGALMPVVFTSTLNQTATPSGPRDWNTDIVYSVSQTSQVYLDHQVSEVDGALHYNWDAIDALFPDGVLDAMVARHAQRLRALANDDAAWRRRRPAHDGDYLPAYNATRSALFDGPCPLLQTLFFRSARIRPDHPAVIAADRTLTYRELAREVRHLTRRLQQAGVAPGTLVAVAMPKGWQQAVATLGILTAGAAYVPIDPALPRARRDELLADAEARIVLRRADCTIDWPVTVESIRIAPLPVADPAVASETDDNADTDPAPVQRATDLAYVIYTSGSTGVPKGVMIDHRGAVNTVLDINHRYGIGADDRIFGLSSLSFDLSVYDLFGTFAAGATLVLPAADQLQQPAHWRERLRSHRVTVWNSVPALMQLLLTATVPADHADALRVVMLSGDWIPLSLPDAIGRAFPDARVISLGGATEASIWSIDYPIEAVDPAWRSIPYGRPLTNQQWYVLDDDLNPCPPWVPGQLYIGGIGVALGYWRQPELTATRFVPNPFPAQYAGFEPDHDAATEADPMLGRRATSVLYRTGDLGVFRPDGTIEFLGREDHQIKINGYRVELGEIEAVLQQHPHLDAAAVAAVGTPTALVAYVVPTLPADADSPHHPLARLDFKREHRGWRAPQAGDIAVELPSSSRDGDVAAHLQRQSHRRFLPDVIPLSMFAEWLSALRARTMPGAPLPKYRHPSAGSLYPLQAYIDVKAGRIEGLDAGWYYYHPGDHRLVRIAAASSVTNNTVQGPNAAVHAGCAFGVVLVAQMRAIEPVYGAQSRDFALIETGYVGQLLMETAPAFALGLCPIGGSDLDAMRTALTLDADQMPLHALLGGRIDPAWNTTWQSASPPPSAAAITDNLQRYLRARLPAYMVPGRFVMLPALPLTPNGKLDRRALPAPDAVRADHRPPVTAIEQTIAELWRSALGVDAIGLDDDFFALGGSSLVAMQLMARLQETFGVELSLGQLFGALTPGAQATLITQLQATTIATVPVTTIQRIVREPGALDTTTDALADLSDASVDAMLQRLLAGRGDGTAG